MHGNHTDFQTSNMDANKDTFNEEGIFLCKLLQSIDSISNIKSNRVRSFSEFNVFVNANSLNGVLNSSGIFKLVNH